MFESTPSAGLTALAAIVPAVAIYALYRLGKAAHASLKTNSLAVPAAVMVAAAFGFLWSVTVAVAGGPPSRPCTPKPELHDTKEMHQFRMDDYARRTEEYREKAERDKRTVPLAVMVGISGVCLLAFGFALDEYNRRDARRDNYRR